MDASRRDRGALEVGAAEPATGADSEPRNASPPSGSEARPFVPEWLSGIFWSFAIIPALFYLQFGEVGDLGWGTTVFVAVLNVLISVGRHFGDRPAYHTPVTRKIYWADKIGAFWLVACAFGPLAGLVVGTAFPLSEGTWRWMYGARVFFAVVLPIFTMLPLVRFVAGPGTLVMSAILLGVTSLPVLTARNTMLDLRDGVVSIENPRRYSARDPQYVRSLPHTGRTLREN